MAKLEIPRFFRDEKHGGQLLDKLKLVECPCCGSASYLIRNGLLYGNDPQQAGCERIERGQRVRCSNRGRKHGCGCSFSIHLAHILPHRSIDSASLAALLKAVLLCAGRIHAAWQQGARQFSLSTLYRIWGELGPAQMALRQRLCQCTGPPPRAETDPRMQLLAHLWEAFPGADPIKAFQARFQTPWLPRFPKHPSPAPTM